MCPDAARGAHGKSATTLRVGGVKAWLMSECKRRLGLLHGAKRYGHTHRSSPAMSFRALMGGALLCVMMFVSACGAGNSGAVELAYVRDGALWTIQPDGGTRFQVAPATIIGFAWSPDHHEFVARFAAVYPIPASADTLLDSVPDMLAGFGVISIDGGNIIPIMPATPNTQRSDAWWDANGNRVFYREQIVGSAASQTQWILSQADQPNGIARKVIATGPTIPTSAPDGSQIVTITPAGDLIIGPPQAATRVLQHNALVTLPNGTWPARPLWQPGHHAILYAVAGPAPDLTTLMLTDLDGKTQRVMTIAALEQYSWSPDGSHVLLRTPAGYTIHPLAGGAEVTWPDADPLSLPWWSPDGHDIVTRSPTTLALVTTATGAVKTLAHLSGAPPTTPTAAAAFFHPITGNPWSPNGQSLALVTGGGTWLGGDTSGTALATKSSPGTGLYIIALSALRSAPKLADWGAHVAPSWSTPDPNTQFVTQ